jgi:hypothetical protein
MYVAMAAFSGAEPPPILFTPQTPSFCTHAAEACVGSQLLLLKHMM